jgi:quercetin dioxygenase-like cupin family protein
MANFFRLYTSEDGETHFEDIDLAPFDVTQMRFATSAPGTFGDWHNERQSQFALVHSGEAEITASDGEVRRMTPGSTMLAEDLTGKGHQMRVIGDEPCVWMFVVRSLND